MKNIAVVCGGYSGERVVSMRSAAMVMENMDRSKFHPIQIVIEESRWFARLDEQEIDVNRNDFSVQTQEGIMRFDGVFMMIHGTPGENGLMQGYFEMIGLPCTTGDVLNMALTFNKKATTRALGAMGYRVAKSVVVRKEEDISAEQLVSQVGLPCFVKPNCGGSSIGTSKVSNANELLAAIERARNEDEDILVEEFISGREVTCGVIVIDGKPTALPITEIVSENEFFDFQAKYEGKSQEITPAPISSAHYERVQNLAARIYSDLNCGGMIRVDFLLPDEEPCVIEVNTVPGFSAASIIPQQAAAMGMDKTTLITTVIESSF
ncbi:MAG: D-alanine--D-alanine ligase [Bacteroidota bacterium]|jgi:D-alanine-D-alanine ligase